MLLILTIIPSDVPASKDIENPYGEDRWQLKGSFRFKKENGSKLETIDLSPNHLGEEGLQFGKMYINITQETGNWAYVNISIVLEGTSELTKEYVSDNRTNTKFKVNKSSNIAYNERTGLMLGFFPFYVYHYTDTKCLGDKDPKVINMGDSDYEINYIDSDGIVYSRTAHHPTGTNHSSSQYELGPSLRIEKKSSKTKGNSLKDHLHISVSSKGHYAMHGGVTYPISVFFPNMDSVADFVDVSFLPAQNDIEEVSKFLRSIDIGDKPEQEDNLVMVALVASLMIVGAVLAYLAYRKQR